MLDIDALLASAVFDVDNILRFFKFYKPQTMADESYYKIHFFPGILKGTSLL